MYRMTYKLGQETSEVLSSTLEQLMAIRQGLLTRGAKDISILLPKATEMDLLRTAVKSMTLEEKLNLIQDFKKYIDYLDKAE